VEAQRWSRGTAFAGLVLPRSFSRCGCKFFLQIFSAQLQDSSYELMDEAEISFAASLIASQGVLAD